MNNFFTRLGLAAIAVVISGLAVAGIWNNSFPIVGGAAYSCSTVNSTSVCTVAAGPTSITGAETFPADTNLSGGRNPQSVIIPTLTMANYARGTGMLYLTGTPVAGVAGTTEQTLATYSLPASTLVTGRALKIRSSFSAAANGNNKTFKCYFGASVISSGVLSTNAKNGSCDVFVVWTAAAAQTVYGNMLVDTTAITGYVNAGTDSTAAAVTVKMTGTGGTTGADITMNVFSVELIGP